MDCKRKKKGEEEKNEKSKGVLNNQSEDLDTTPPLHYVTLHTMKYNSSCCNIVLCSILFNAMLFYAVSIYTILYPTILTFQFQKERNKSNKHMKIMIFQP